MKKEKVENHIDSFHNFVSTHKNKKIVKATKCRTLKVDEKIVTDLAGQRNLNPKLAMTKQRHLIFTAGSQRFRNWQHSNQASINSLSKILECLL